MRKVLKIACYYSSSFPFFGCAALQFQNILEDIPSNKINSLGIKINHLFVDYAISCDSSTTSFPNKNYVPRKISVFAGDNTLSNTVASVNGFSARKVLLSIFDGTAINQDDKSETNLNSIITKRNNSNLINPKDTNFNDLYIIPDLDYDSWRFKYNCSSYFSAHIASSGNVNSSSKIAAGEIKTTISNDEKNSSLIVGQAGKFISSLNNVLIIMM